MSDTLTKGGRVLHDGRGHELTELNDRAPQTGQLEHVKGLNRRITVRGLSFGYGRSLFIIDWARAVLGTENERRNRTVLLSIRKDSRFSLPSFLEDSTCGQFFSVGSWNQNNAKQLLDWASSR